MKPHGQLIAAEARTEWTEESGQSVVVLALIMGLFLLGVLGFGVDLTSVWFHRQAAQAAADSACQAGALDMLAASGGLTPPAAGFTTGTAGNCVGSPAATMCFYAKQNGYDGAGLNASQESNSVSWTFPQTVPGVTGAVSSNAFLQVRISENVPAYFMGMVKAQNVVNINVSSTCGIAAVKDAAPMMVLHPTMSGSFTYTGGGTLDIVGGPYRGVQVNSSSSTAVAWTASGIIDLSKGGPYQTGSDIGIVGGPTTIPTNGSSVGYKGGTTGAWKSGVIPVPDPYASVGPPTGMLGSTQSGGTWVAYNTDGCPDNSKSTGSTAEACMEFQPGYYPNGINLSTMMNSYSTAIFHPGIYYLNGSLVASSSNVMRVAVPGNVYVQTDGVMFYFLSGSLNISGGSNTHDVSGGSIAGVPSSRLTCDGSTPPTALGLSTTLHGNVLYGQCTANATYVDSFNDTTDTLSASGSRGLLIYQAHSNTTAPSFTGSGALAFSGALYFHSTSYGTVLTLNGGASSGTFVLGDIVTDQVNLSGSGTIKLALNPAKTTNLAKVAMFQ